MATNLIVEHISHRYSHAWALRGLSMELSNNGVYGLLGANGSGKSTLMNIICGVLKPTEGKVIVNGTAISMHAKLAKSQLGFMPQQPPLYEDFTVEEFLNFTAALRVIPQQEISRAVEEVMVKTGLIQFRSRLISNLSGGYRQRVGLAQAIVHKPALIVLDEPTNNLDPNQVLEVRKLIKEIAQDSTVLISSHILTEISLLCKHIFMIEGGRMVFSDGIDAFNNYAQPNSLLVKWDQLPPLAKLQELPAVTRVELVNEKQYRIYFKGDHAIAEAVVQLSYQNDWDLHELQLEKSHLEDIFKQLSESI